MFCTFGELIKDIRVKNNLTLIQMSKKIDIDNSLLGKIENNSRNPTMELIKKISSEFNYDFDTLLIAYQSDKLIYQLNKNSYNIRKKVIESFLHKLDNEIKRTSE